jgi:hypothetical protein
VDHADADMRLADIDIPHLLVEQLFRKRLLGVALEFAQGNVGPGAHDAGRLGVGGIHPGGILGQYRLASTRHRIVGKLKKMDFMTTSPYPTACMHGHRAFPSFPCITEDSVTAR